MSAVGARDCAGRIGIDPRRERDEPRGREEIAISREMTEIGVPKEGAELIAPLAEADPLTGLNPRSVDAAAYVELYEAALSGTLARG